MPLEGFDVDPVQELREAAAAAAQLGKDPAVFKAAFEAFQAEDAARFQEALERAGVRDRCRVICRLFCQKRCIAVCRRFCPDQAAEVLDPEEIRAFATAVAQLAAEEGALERLVAILEREDLAAWQEEIKKRELGRFCHQLCHFLCRVHCRRRCFKLCPPDPLITRVASIPVTQISPAGYGSGPSSPPIQVPAPNPAAGVGDHVFGAGATLMGVFNMPTATQYKVEISDSPGGTYDPISVPVTDYELNPTPPPFLVAVTRFPSGGADPGWYDVSQIPLSDGGPSPTGEKRLLDWPTSALPDGVYYLRLRVRDGTTERASAPQVVRTDNTAPPTPVITLQLQKADGTRTELKCGKVKKGDGLIVVTVQAFDPNFSSLGVAAQGNSSLTVPIVDTSSVPLSKTYNGNVADQGYPVPTEFLWDPWSDPRIVPCCYVVRIDITDRAVLNNSWQGGHGNSGWEALEIGF
jgi:hypothetical protein